MQKSKHDDEKLMQNELFGTTNGLNPGKTRDSEVRSSCEGLSVVGNGNVLTNRAEVIIRVE